MSLTDIPQNIVYLIICLSILVVAHEWGHFIVARIFGIRVDDFSVGFGKRILRIGKLGNTEYNLRILPLGGFVKIHGMDADEEPLVRARDQVKSAMSDDPTRTRLTEDPNAHELPLAAENTPEVQDEPGPDSFASKPIWQRSLVIFAGPLMSFLLGYVVLCLIGWVHGIPSGATLNKVTEVQPGGEGQRIGLRTNDEIVAIDGKPITTGAQMIDTIYNNRGNELRFTIKRGDQVMELKGTPRPMSDDDGKPINMPRVSETRVLAPGIELRAGDVVEAVNELEPKNAQEATSLFHKNAGKLVTVQLVRNLARETQHGTLPANLSALPPITDFQPGVLNFYPAAKWERLSFTASVRAGNRMTMGFFRALGEIFSHHKQLQKSVGGPIAIFHQTKLAAKRGLADVVLLFAQISLCLAVFNMLPIPVLDGGHLLSLAIEAARRGKKFTARQQQAMLLTGFAIIITLVIVIFTNDILKTVRGQIPQ